MRSWCFVSDVFENGGREYLSHIRVSILCFIKYMRQDIRRDSTGALPEDCYGHKKYSHGFLTVSAPEVLKRRNE